MFVDGLVNGALGIAVGFNCPDGAQHQSEPGALPDLVLVKFHDTNVGRIHRVHVPDAPEVEAVAIKPVTQVLWSARCNTPTCTTAATSLLGSYHTQSSNHYSSVVLH